MFLSLFFCGKKKGGGGGDEIKKRMNSVHNKLIIVNVILIDPIKVVSFSKNEYFGLQNNETFSSLYNNFYFFVKSNSLKKASVGKCDFDFEL